MVGLLSRIQSSYILVAGLVLVLLQGVGGMEHTVLTWLTVVTGIGFALVEVSKEERIGLLIGIMFLAVVGIGGLTQVPIIPAIWAAVAGPLMIWATSAGSITLAMLFIDILD